MALLKRLIKPLLDNALEKGNNLLILGARQTGKTTLVKSFSCDLQLNFMHSPDRQRYEKNPEILANEVKMLVEKMPAPPLISIDEAQKVPAILDQVQYLIDEGLGQYILTGSSARKLKQSSPLNWLPGRVMVYRMEPLMLQEYIDHKPSLEDLLHYGSLPGIFTEPDHNHRERHLQSYVATYLEEEIRSEALVRQLASFARFLTLAAVESGNITNFSNLSRQIGVAHSTVAGYYQILEDCLVAERIEPLAEQRPRKRLTRSAKYLFTDLGLRRIAAGEGLQLPQVYLGKLFEQYVGLELLRSLRLMNPAAKLYFWRDNNGPEIDWVIKTGNEYIPIEVKWTDAPHQKTLRHLMLFMKSYPCKKGYVICRIPRPMKLADNLYAYPWQELQAIFH